MEVDAQGEAGAASEGGASTPQAPAEAPGREDPVLEALGHDPATFDTLSARTGLPSDRLSARLLDLELAGQVQRLPGSMWQRRMRA